MSMNIPSKNTQSTDAQSNEYFAKRSLKGGAVGWVLLISLGVSYTISGDFSGWNYGMEQGGWLGLAIAWAVMGLMYACTVFGLAELSSAIPTAGAGYAFARSAMGRTGGFATGLALIIEYVCAPAAIATFIANYVLALGIVDVDPLVIVAIAYIIFIAIHIFGVGEALKLMLVISAIAIVALIAFTFGMLPSFDTSNLFNMPASENAGGNELLPFGLLGVLGALPYGIWFFLGVEGVPLAAEEAANPKRDMPRGLIGALVILGLTGFLSLLLAAGGAGAALIAPSDAPLVDALNAVGQSDLAVFVNWAGLAGLIASFFSLMYAGSRQVFALSRAGYLPNFLALTGKRKTPYVALIASGIVGFIMVIVMQDGSLILNIAVFGACVSYALMNLSHIILRLRNPGMHRGYRTPGGMATTLVGFILSCIAIVSTFFVDVVAASCVLIFYIIGMAYFSFYSKKHLISNAPEEEFAKLNQAESELR